MNKEQQDLAWASLPKEARENISYSYQNSPCGSWVESLFEEIYGEHNLTSDTEPEELIFAPKWRVEQYLKGLDVCIDISDLEQVKALRNALEILFGDKCLPDKEEPNPTFPIGSIVRITNKKNPYHGHKGKFGKVITYDAKYNRYAIEGIPSEWEEGDLEPYTEPSNVSTNDTKDDTKNPAIYRKTPQIAISPKAIN